MIAIDTNLLVYAHRQGCPEHVVARQAIERADTGADGWCIPLPCLLEFWCVVTHPSSSGGPASPVIARRFVQALCEPGHAQVLQPGPSFAQRCLQVAERMGVTGARVFDLQIGLLCLEAGVVELWTHDVGFVALPGLAVRDPLAA